MQLGPVWRGRRSAMVRFGKRFGIALSALLIVVIVVVGGTYLRLLIGPVSLNLFRDRISQTLQQSLPDGFDVDLGSIELALGRGGAANIRVSPLILLEAKTNARIEVREAQVRFRPVSFLQGKSSAQIDLFGAEIGLVYDEQFGFRLATLVLHEDDTFGDRVEIQGLDGEAAAPSQGVSIDDIIKAVRPEPVVRASETENGPSLHNIFRVGMEDFSKSLSLVASDAHAGNLANVALFDSSLSLLDPQAGQLRQISGVDVKMGLTGPSGQQLAIDIEPSRTRDVANRWHVSLLHRKQKTGAVLSARFDRFDLPTLFPLFDLPETAIAIRGAGDVGIDFFYDSAEKLDHATGHISMESNDLFLVTETLPIHQSRINMSWVPDDASITFEPSRFVVGENSTDFTGFVAFSQDEKLGDVLALTLEMKDFVLAPTDLDGPREIFDRVAIEGWFLPNHGVLGFDRISVFRETELLSGSGRFDFLPGGLAISADVKAVGGTADDYKRLWPYFIAGEARDWFVDHVREGVMKDASLSFRFPSGSIPPLGVRKRIPEGGISVDLLADAVAVKPVDTLPTLFIEEALRFQVIDHEINAQFGFGETREPGSDFIIKNATYLNPDTYLVAQVGEFTGDISGDTGTLLNVAMKEPISIGAMIDLDITPDAIAGHTDVSVLATVPTSAQGDVGEVNFAINGTMHSFSSEVSIVDRIVQNGSFSFTASQDGYRIAGNAQLDGTQSEIVFGEDAEGAQELYLSSVMSAEDRKKIGLDLAPYLTGPLKYSVTPLENGDLQLALDLTQSALNISDLAITKAAGVEGKAQLVLKQNDGGVQIDDFVLSFGTTKIAGSFALDKERKFVNANFPIFVLRQDDNAALSVRRVAGGYKIAINGDQLDLRPILKRFFGLSEGSSLSSRTDLQGDALSIDVNLVRGLGFYSTTGFNTDLTIAVRGPKLLSIDGRVQLGGNASLSVSTNQVASGKVITYASNDVGTLLRFMGLYSRLVDGNGSLVIRYNEAESQQEGQFSMQNFSFIEEKALAEIIGKHQGSRSLIAQENRVSFQRGRATFTRTDDRLIVHDAALDGISIGATLRGSIDNKNREYDLVGTYLPLFGLNKIFRQVPIFGQLFGGREGEGLIGVTFAIKGPLDEPRVFVNPASILAPGALRYLFEFQREFKEE